MSERFAELVNWASKNYDLVLIDTPPILALPMPQLLVVMSEPR